jgi:hypothetical protein
MVPALLTLAALVVQPDASQASALALAMGVVLLGMRTLALPLRWGISIMALLLAALVWTRPDPLAPVAEVEEVIKLAAGLSPLIAIISVLSVAAVASTPVLTTRTSHAVAWTGWALSALFVGWSVAPALGAFPVPLVGVGVAPILGAWLGVGLLGGMAGRPTNGVD